ncbi:unnamed protein product [Rhizoctonia solani]|uniref:MPN domain-containing protein n=1 Tax=Rhizoctonia solani TaxID=456999 RepID=A0A8H2Y3W7_9AGAM|nr:unnamed protein product [Rhizoctonia solani]
MALNPNSSALYLQAPSSTAGSSGPRPVTTVTLHPVALFSILDHFLRRTESQERVIGTLLGTRTETEIEVKSSFAVIHNETDEQVALDMDYHRTMYDLHQKVNPKEVIVGWYGLLLYAYIITLHFISRYSTGTDLNTYSALIQNFYSQETAPYQAVHVVLDTGVREGVNQGVKAYVRYVLVAYVDLLNATANATKHTTSPASELEILEQAIDSVSDMIDRVLKYVKQDTLTISYLANIVRSEVEVSSRMALVT